MEAKNSWNKQVQHRVHTLRPRFFFAGTLTLALLVAGAVVRGQEAPPTPDPPEPPEAPQVFVLNDGGEAHLGVTLGDVSTAKAEELRLPAVAGALVNSVQKDSPAAKAGIEPGDAIMEFDGVRVRSSTELRRLIRETPPGRTVAIKLVRGGKTQVVTAQLDASKEHFTFNMPEVHIPPVNIPKFYFSIGGTELGISADNLTPQLAQFFGVNQGRGVLISEVTQGGPADKAGLKAGDVIVQVDGKAVGSVEELRSSLNDNFTDDTRKASLTIVRDHHEQNVTADLTRSHKMEQRPSTALGPRDSQALAQLRAQIRAEMLKQKQDIRMEWQRQIQQQMLQELEDQIKEMPNVRVSLNSNTEI